MGSSDEEKRLILPEKTPKKKEKEGTDYGELEASIEIQVRQSAIYHVITKHEYTSEELVEQVR